MSSSNAVLCVWKEVPLPVPLFEEVHSFLVEYDYYRLLISSKKLFSEIKYETRKVTKFLEPEEDPKLTVEQLSRLIRRPYDQLILRAVSVEEMQDFDFVCQLPLFKLELEEAGFEKNYLERIVMNKRHLALSSVNDITELPALPNTESLILRFCSLLTSFLSFPNLKKLELSQCYQLVDVGCFKDMEVLNLWNCPRVVDVSQLGNIPRLILSDCPGITDISALTNNHFLSITQCSMISEVSPSKTMNNMYFQTDLHPLLFETISFRFLRAADFEMNFTDFWLSNNARLFHLSITHCYSIQSLGSNFRNITVVAIRYCPNLTDISGLGENKSVTIRHCNRLTNFSSLRSIPRVSLLDCKISNAEDISHVHHLSLFRCFELKDISGFTNNVHRLEIGECENVGNHGTLGRIPILEFIGSVGTAELCLKYFAALGADHEKIVFPRNAFPKYQTDFPFIGNYHIISESIGKKLMINLLRKC
jgi:hypothetical protein